MTTLAAPSPLAGIAHSVRDGALSASLPCTPCHRYTFFGAQVNLTNPRTHASARLRAAIPVACSPSTSLQQSLAATRDYQQQHQQQQQHAHILLEGQSTKKFKPAEFLKTSSPLALEVTQQQQHQQPHHHDEVSNGHTLAHGHSHEMTAQEQFALDPTHWRQQQLRQLHHEDELSIVLGIDFGGTGIKGAPVDVSTGKLLLDRFRIPTPSPATPAAVAEVVRQIKNHFHWDGPIGIGVPSVVRRGIVRSAANIDKSWINIHAVELFEQTTGCHVAAINDADAAGFAEMRFGAGRPLQRDGVVLMTTFGTGIGTALFVGGRLVPNLEMGHIEVGGFVAERVASAAVKERTDMSWKKWAGKVNEYLARMDHYLQPDLIIIGGGVSKKDEKFLHLLSVPAGTPIVRAEMRNEAGIVGAAVGAANGLAERRAVQEAERLTATLLS